MSEITKGEGYAIGHIDDMGDRYGFRKVRRALDVTAFGVNALVLPPNYDAGRHFHDEQQELYFVHSGTVEMRFEDGSTHRMEPGPPPASTPPPCAGWPTWATRTR